MIKNKYKTFHKNNYLVILSDKKENRIRCFINARDKKQALYLAIKRYIKSGYSYDISRARIAGVFDNVKKRIVIK